MDSRDSSYFDPQTTGDEASQEDRDTDSSVSRVRRRRERDIGTPQRIGPVFAPA